MNEESYVGCIESYGGGSSDAHPGTFLLLQDNVSPTQPWGFDFVSTGAGNASAWGDYMVAQPLPAGNRSLHRHRLGGQQQRGGRTHGLCMGPWKRRQWLQPVEVTLNP